MGGVHDIEGAAPPPPQPSPLKGEGELVCVLGSASGGTLEVEIVPFDPATLLKIALFNPVVIVVAFLMGRRADQWQKLIVAAFAASLAGYALYWLVAAVGLMPVHALGGEAAVVLMQFLFGLVWAGLGYWLAPLRR